MWQGVFCKFFNINHSKLSFFLWYSLVDSYVGKDKMITFTPHISPNRTPKSIAKPDFLKAQPLKPIETPVSQVINVDSMALLSSLQAYSGISFKGKQETTYTDELLSLIDWTKDQEETPKETKLNAINKVVTDLSGEEVSEEMQTDGIFYLFYTLNHWNEKDKDIRAKTIEAMGDLVPKVSSENQTLIVEALRQVFGDKKEPKVLKEKVLEILAKAGPSCSYQMQTKLVDNFAKKINDGPENDFYQVCTKELKNLITNTNSSYLSKYALQGFLYKYNKEDALEHRRTITDLINFTINHANIDPEDEEKDFHYRYRLENMLEEEFKLNDKKDLQVIESLLKSIREIADFPDDVMSLAVDSIKDEDASFRIPFIKMFDDNKFDEHLSTESKRHFSCSYFNSVLYAAEKALWLKNNTPDSYQQALNLVERMSKRTDDNTDKFHIMYDLNCLLTNHEDFIDKSRTRTVRNDIVKTID